MLICVLPLCLMLQMDAAREQAAEPADEPLRVRVLSYNIRHGRGMDDAIDLPRIAAVIRQTKPDLVALQEVDREARRSGGVDQAAELGRLTGMQAVFGRARDFQGGEYGNAVLSRLPILESQVHPLPETEGIEPRSVLEVRIAMRDQEMPLVFVSTHLDYRALEERMRQIERLNEIFVGDEHPPTLLVGDMNDMPDSPTLVALQDHWANATAGQDLPTFPAAQPTRQIDFVLFRPAGAWRVIEARVIEEPLASDHRPLMVVLEWVGDDVQ
jgi:endonuclease/exonuclease/phosphatase family metal-dependent hydrolase